MVAWENDFFKILYSLSSYVGPGSIKRDCTYLQYNILYTALDREKNIFLPHNQNLAQIYSGNGQTFIIVSLFQDQDLI